MSTKITSNDPSIASERSYKDLDLNFKAHPVKKDINKHFNEKAVINSVKNLVSTNFYERPYAAPDENGYSVSLVFFILNSPNPITINFFLERIR